MRRSEKEGLGGFTDSEGAQAAAMAWRPVLQSVARACEGEGGVEARVCAKGGAAEPWGAYIGPGGEGKRLPAAMAINVHATLIGNQEGGLRWGNNRVMAGE
jgi:hypothetical protein